jgi:hypothetical protein
MINSAHPSLPSSEADDPERVHAVVNAGPRGAIILAGLATFIVVAIWTAFYLLVFIPRGATQ